MLAKIAVSAAIYAIDKPYSYRVPQGMPLQAGMRVSVPFGRSNRVSEGVVLELGDGDERKLKAVIAPLDTQPLLDEKSLRLAAFIRERYFCTYYDAVKAILPAGLWFARRERYSIAENAQWREIKNAAAFSVMQAIEALGGAADYEELRKQFEEEQLQDALRYLQRKKLLFCDAEHRRRVSDKTERIAVLSASASEAQHYANAKRKTAPMQQAVLEMLITLGQCSVKDLRYYTGASAATLNRLEQLGYLSYTEQELLRAVEIVPAKLEGELKLNEEQSAVFQGLQAQRCSEKPGIALLSGVTGSGKTSVYIKLIAACLAEGKSAILLVPEIALTPQLLSLFAAHFASMVAVLHSSLQIGQRYDEYKRIAAGDARVVIGTRSAIFAPAKNLGVIIIDEEQEHTYKSENSPRYHAREIAIYRGAQEKALVLLGSATASVSSMYLAKQGIYSLYTLRNRYNGRQLPPVEIVDMKQELKAGNGGAISEQLLCALRETCAAGRQAILFLNRRGSSRMVSCVDCGYVPMCPGCSVNLTYHHANARLMCHHCGHAQLLPAHCPACGGHLKQIGFGTQKVQQQLENLLPGVQVLRMDADTVSAVNTHDKLLSRFRDENIPILLGTQMIAKGLDFENVTLVGVLDADLSLYIGNYRAAETTFNMITQVVGRAGRGEASGRAMIQTMTPRNQVICLAATQDYERFYETELPLRKVRGCPPFFDLIALCFHGAKEEAVWQAAQRFRAALAEQLATAYYKNEQVALLGPAPAAVARVNYNYRCKLTLSCKNTRTLRQLLAHEMRQFARDKQNRDIGVFADVNGNE
ncbi:MAG: primosomal protein N' [Oscillospiraceae bacterium]|nr:primosomal protein N' [Oscillospiraceae bacterium]